MSICCCVSSGAEDMLLFSTGVGGNLVAVQASRLSTALHQVSKPGTLPPGSVHGCPNLCSAFCDSSKQSFQYISLVHINKL